jgi:hypothetical protein
MSENIDLGLELVHRLVGYPLAFVIAPLAVATFAGKPGHHWSGKAYAIVMTFLYVTGTALTLTRHPWGTWEFGRNVIFNLLGYSLLLHGWRSMWLMTHNDAPRPVLLDRVLLGALIAMVAVMTSLAVMRGNTPLHVFSVIGIGLVVLELRDWRNGLKRPALYRRHARYMLGSYFYVLTVVSLVHLKDELRSDARWLWPSAFALGVIWFIGEGSRANKWAVRATLVVAMAFAAYVGYDSAVNGFTSARAGQR